MIIYSLIPPKVIKKERITEGKNNFEPKFAENERRQKIMQLRFSQGEYTIR